MEDNREIELLNLDITTAVFFIITILVSIFLTTEAKKRLEKKITVFTKKDDQYIALFNRIIVVLIVLVILYDNYELFLLAKEQGKDLKPFILQLVSSTLGIITALIILYVVLYTWDTDSVANEENPVF